MKKFIALLLAMLCLSIPVMAEEIDFSSMDLAALLKLHEQLDAAIREQIDCVLDGNNLYQGIYVVGQDITPGRYLLTSLSKTYFMCHLYEDEAHKAAHDGGQHETLLAVGDTLSIKFEEGMVFVVDQGAASVKAVEDPDWAP
jgi:hypothetical protein